MTKLLKYMVAAVVIVALAIPTGMSIVKANKIPTFDIVSVVPDEVVTIQTYDFPAGKTFNVLIGKYGTYGISGTKVATQDSAKGGTFTSTYEIPEEYQGVALLSIRLEDKETGYYAYNWFENKAMDVNEPVATAAAVSTVESPNTITPEEMKHPSFIISAVDADKSIQVQGSNYPEDEVFDVYMGVFGTNGIGGEKVTTQKTGAKGEFKATYTIPADFKGAYMIAVRMESQDSDYYAFNYFYNATYAPTEVTTAASTTASAKTTPAANTTPAAKPTSGAEASPTMEESTYQGYPFFTVSEVKKDATVKIDAENLPADEVFDVYMSDFLSTTSTPEIAGKLEAGKGGKASGSFTIPADLKGVAQISIRLSGEKTGYFAYNYFFNSDYPYVAPTATATTAPTATKAAATPTAEAKATATPEVKATEAATPEAGVTPTK
jgi:hypothetical protein